MSDAFVEMSRVIIKMLVLLVVEKKGHRGITRETTGA